MARFLPWLVSRARSCRFRLRWRVRWGWRAGALHKAAQQWQNLRLLYLPAGTRLLRGNGLVGHLDTNPANRLDESERVLVSNVVANVHGQQGGRAVTGVTRPCERFQEPLHGPAFVPVDRRPQLVHHLAGLVLQLPLRLQDGRNGFVDSGLQLGLDHAVVRRDT
mmetsp:Transcript_34735/g.59544  ORF Transcript_34735/g.59544 Transcript_34735/m.59544 type:complete len:164 (-) Transcript_34735:257-748(-)